VKRLALIIVAGGWLLGGTGPAWSQDGRAPSPHAVIVPDRAHWTIVLQFSGQDGQAGAKPAVPKGYPVKIDVVKVQTAKRVTLFFADGTSQQIDQMGPYVFMSSPQGVHLVPANDDPPPYPFYTEGFLFADWINTEAASAFQANIPHDGALCRHYVSASGGEVWINAKTGLPDEARMGTIVAKYRFEDPPESPPDFSPEEKALLAKIETAARMMQMAK
jgi:hypothetical protein